MVPTEEERLPIRVPVSVRGLNASELLPHTSFRPFPIFASHVRRASCRARIRTLSPDNFAH